MFPDSPEGLLNTLFGLDLDPLDLGYSFRFVSRQGQLVPFYQNLQTGRIASWLDVRDAVAPFLAPFPQPTPLAEPHHIPLANADRFRFDDGASSDLVLGLQPAPTAEWVMIHFVGGDSDEGKGQSTGWRPLSDVGDALGLANMSGIPLGNIRNITYDR